MPKDPFQYFRPEARELLEQLTKGVLDLEAGRTGVVSQLLRLAHTLKGAARVVRQAAIADLAHAIEDALAPFRESGASMPPERVDALLKTLDAIGDLVSGLPPAPASDTSKPGQPPRDDVFSNARAVGAEPDAVLNGVTA